MADSKQVFEKNGMIWRTGLSGATASFAVAALVSVCASGAAADGTFLQIDLSPDASSAVVTVTRGRFSLGALHSDYEGGAATRVSLLYGVPLDGGTTVKVGPSLGVTYRDGQDDDREIGLKTTIDRYATTGFGGLYLLGELDSIDRSWFLLAQASFDPPGISIELSAGGSDEYRDATVAISRQLGDGPVSLRGGWRIESEEAFLGLSVNTF